MAAKVEYFGRKSVFSVPLFVGHINYHRMELSLAVEGMTCMHCARRVKTALEEVEGVSDAQVSWERGTAVVSAEGVSKDRLAEAVSETELYKVIEE